VRVHCSEAELGVVDCRDCDLGISKGVYSNPPLFPQPSLLTLTPLFSLSRAPFTTFLYGDVQQCLSLETFRSTSLQHPKFLSSVWKQIRARSWLCASAQLPATGGAQRGAGACCHHQEALQMGDVRTHEVWTCDFDSNGTV